MVPRAKVLSSAPRAIFPRRRFSRFLSHTRTSSPSVSRPCRRLNPRGRDRCKAGMGDLFCRRRIPTVLPGCGGSGQKSRVFHPSRARGWSRDRRRRAKWENSTRERGRVSGWQSMVQNIHRRAGICRFDPRRKPGREKVKS